jgi:hypothetical protein
VPHVDTHATIRARSILKTACTVFIAASSVVALALPAQAADDVNQSEVTAPVDATAPADTAPADTAPAEATPADGLPAESAPVEGTETAPVVEDAAPAEEPVPSDEPEQVPADEPAVADEAEPELDEDGLDATAAVAEPALDATAGLLRTLTARVVPGGGMIVLVFDDLPAGATAVELKVTGTAAAKTTSVVACGSWGECDRDPIIVAQKGKTVSGTQIIPLGGNAKNRVTLHSSAAAVKVTPGVVRFVVDEDAAPAKPAPAKPAPAPAKPAPAPAPVPGGKPGPNNTGVPAGKSLKVHDGDLTITTAGTVIDGLDIRGFVRVKAPNVTIKNSIVRGAPIKGNMSLVQASSTGLVIQDSELTPTQKSPYINGIVGKGFTLKRVDIHHVVDQVHLTGGGVRVEASWLHDNLHYAKDPNHSDGSHDDSIQIQAGSGIVIVNNTIEDANNAGVMITQDTGKVSNVTFADNHADGGACTINVAEKGKGSIKGLSIVENTFGRDTRHKNCAILAPTTTKVAADDNFYTDGKPVAVSKG